MPHDRATGPAQRPAPIKVPDQVQQAQRPDAPRKNEAPAEPGRTTGGILHELKTERAHD